MAQSNSCIFKQHQMHYFLSSLLRDQAIYIFYSIVAKRGERNGISKEGTTKSRRGIYAAGICI